MSCSCKEIARALFEARLVASEVERVCSGVAAPSIRLRLARAHALGVCDELDRELEGGRAECACRRQDDGGASFAMSA